MKTNLILITSLLILATNCQPPQPAETVDEKPAEATVMSKKGLVKIAIMYPNGEGNTFDMDYYSTKHMPMVAELFGDAMKLMEIEKGVAGRTPEDEVPYLAIGYFFFNSIDEYNAAFGPNAEQILNDIPNYTNIQPTIQISEVVL